MQVVRRLQSLVRCDVHLYALDLERTLPSLRSEVPVDVRPLSSSELDAYRDLRPSDDSDSARARLERGHVCFVSWLGDRIVGCAWIRFDRMWVSEIGESIPLLSGEAYGYDSYTHPEHRGRGMADVRSEAILRHVKTLGYRRLVAYVGGGNVAGHAALAKLGFAVVGRIRWLHVGRYGICVSRGRVPSRLGFHVRPRTPEV